MTAGQVDMPGGRGGIPLEVPMEEVKGLAGFWQRQRWTVFTVVELVVFLVAWDIAIARLELVHPALFPAPSNMFWEFVRMVSGAQIGTMYLWEHLAFSARNYVVGYTLGASLGIIIGLAVGASRTLDKMWGPLIWSLYSTPIITVRPLLILWFGIGWTGLAVLVFLSAFFPVVIQTMAGVATVETPLLRAARVFGANRVQVYYKVILPYTVPFILTGLRLAIGTALIGMLVGEMVGSNLGLGFIVTFGTAKFNMSMSFVAVVMIVAMSLALVNSMKLLEDRVSPWRKKR